MVSPHSVRCLLFALHHPHEPTLLTGRRYTSVDSFLCHHLPSTASMLTLPTQPTSFTLRPLTSRLIPSHHSLHHSPTKGPSLVRPSPAINQSLLPSMLTPTPFTKRHSPVRQSPAIKVCATHQQADPQPSQPAPPTSRLIPSHHGLCHPPAGHAPRSLCKPS